METAVNFITELGTLILMLTLFSALVSSHPLSLCILLVGMAFSVCTLLGSVLSKWLMYAVILIFLGGMMVVFIYATTLSGNEKFFLRLPPLTYPALTLVFISWSLPVFSPQSGNFVSHLFSLGFSGFLLSLIIVLLLALFSVVKMSESFKGAMLKLK